MASDMEVHMKQRCGTEFLCMQKMAATDIPWHLLNVYGDQPATVSTVRQWVVRFCSGNSDVKDKQHSRQPCTAVTPQNEDSLYQLTCTNLWIMTSEMCIKLNNRLQCAGNNGGNVDILQRLHLRGPTDTHIGTERTPYASLSGTIEPGQGCRGHLSGSHHYQIRCHNSSPWVDAMQIPH